MTTLDSTDDTLAPGSRFASYEIVQLIGMGQFGAVYEAVRGGQSVALKVLHVEVQKDDEIVVRFTREAKAIALLRHPNIVGAADVGEHEGRPFLAMELLKGEVLGALMAREKKLSLMAALDIAIPLMSAVRNVHAQGIVHRDLKPDNVFVTRNAAGVAVPKILDFGFVKIAEPGLQLTGKDTAIGTPSFMSPEQMLSPRSVDPRSDQWALGVLVYYLLTGVKPYDGKVLAETLKNVLTRTPPPPRELCPEIPEKASASIMRALSKPPDDRHASVHDFAQTLLPFARPEVAFAYASEFFAESVWDRLGLERPPLQAPEPPPLPTRRSRASRPSGGTTGESERAVNRTPTKSSPAAERAPSHTPTRSSPPAERATRSSPAAERAPSRTPNRTPTRSSPPTGAAMKPEDEKREIERMLGKPPPLPPMVVFVVVFSIVISVAVIAHVLLT